MPITIGKNAEPRVAFDEGSYLFKPVTYNSDPGSGYLNLNNQNSSTADKILISYKSLTGFNMEPFLRTISTGDVITLFGTSNGINNYIYDVTAPVDLQLKYARVEVTVSRIEGFIVPYEELRILTGSSAGASHDIFTLHSGDTTQESANLVGQELELVQATPSTDGVMSSEDKTKLDGIENFATADQIAIEVLYDNTVSGLVAINVQAAIDEMATNGTISGVDLFVSHREDFVFHNGHVIVKNYIT